MKCQNKSVVYIYSSQAVLNLNIILPFYLPYFASFYSHHLIINLPLDLFHSMHIFPIQKMLSLSLSLSQRCAWVGLRGFFDLTHHGGSKKIQPNLTQPNPTYHISPTQPNPTHMDRVEPMGMKFFIIIIKLSKKNIKILKKPKDQYQCNSLKANNIND